jgi:hypothetical protein
MMNRCIAFLQKRPLSPETCICLIRTVRWGDSERQANFSVQGAVVNELYAHKNETVKHFSTFFSKNAQMVQFAFSILKCSQRGMLPCNASEESPEGRFIAKQTIETKSFYPSRLSFERWPKGARGRQLARCRTTPSRHWLVPGQCPPTAFSFLLHKEAVQQIGIILKKSSPVCRWNVGKRNENALRT